MPHPIVGLHHVTAIASDPQRILDFYTQVLGLRFVKRTVNFARRCSAAGTFEGGANGADLSGWIWPIRDRWTQ
jgi:glyoxalase family protein